MLKRRGRERQRERERERERNTCMSWAADAAFLASLLMDLSNEAFSKSASLLISFALAPLRETCRLVCVCFWSWSVRGRRAKKKKKTKNGRGEYKREEGDLVPAVAFHAMDRSTVWRFHGWESTILTTRRRKAVECGVCRCNVVLGLPFFFFAFKFWPHGNHGGVNYICMSYIHTCMHTYMHAYIHTCIHTCMHAYIHACIQS